ncbi:LacI family DNA-binding transcriptional regulator [Alloscardovia omnicolens]|uniref:LacI family DNA-binding transcriptional regulator n=1 Tax=Alloscardovia omnicolens TaxID=419015 RepID=UPI0006661D10|nr:LacI family DNA-binding transcriptional regulator [Alloscardovia omnicolens]MDK8073715.1 LacI family DNA-binding transcriptional regulator [Alloscardovia omnicolens]
MAGKTKVTISDVARTAGVSNSAVSYALNGKPGVSEDTREKVLKVAEQMGWKPNMAAKALSDASTRTVGLVIEVDSEVLSVESYFMELIAGLGDALEDYDYSLLVRIVSDSQSAMRIHRNWIATGSVDAMLVMNVEVGDPRIDFYKEHSAMPVLAIADPSVTHGLPSMTSDDAEGARMIVDYLHELGHTHIARVAGPERYAHTFIRDRAFMEESASLGMTCDCLHSDYSPEQGRDMTNRLFAFSDSPTAIVYDNDVMAIEALHVAAERGLSVPDDISIMSWDDSFACTATTPGITALWRDIPRLGAKAVPMLMDLIEGNTVENAMESPYELVQRGSTGAPKIVGE